MVSGKIRLEKDLEERGKELMMDKELMEKIDREILMCKIKYGKNWKKAYAKLIFHYSKLEQ